MLSVLKKDGTVIVDHADGTRITTFYQQGELQQQLLPGARVFMLHYHKYNLVNLEIVSVSKNTILSVSKSFKSDFRRKPG